jgi:DNA anti-recombination protein RmuC
MEKFEQIKALIEQTQGDLEKFFAKGNSTAGTRVRKAMQELKDLAQELRKEIQETKNSNS